jgi:hypothetical protein
MSKDTEATFCQSELFPPGTRGAFSSVDPEMVAKLRETAVGEEGPMGFRAVCPTDGCERACMVQVSQTGRLAVAMSGKVGVCHEVYSTARRFLPPGA